MDTTFIIIGVVTAIVLFVVGGFLGVYFSRRQRTKRLQKKFGPEYKRMVEEKENRTEVEDELESRLERVESLDIQPLPEERKEWFAGQWQATQAEFVDHPLQAIQKADYLITEIMHEKGYPVEDFERRAADISVDYPELVGNYRGVRDIVTKSEREEVSTEELRQALIHCRALFEELLGIEASIKQ